MAEDKKFKYDPFSYDAYRESDTVKQAEAALQAQIAAKPGAYKSPWQTQLSETMQKILNRDPFSYDLNGDALYQQYKDRYIQQGKMAMQDTMGKAAAMTGGYGNSYAQSVGQQAYQASLGQLNDVIPELYQMAYDQYNQQGQDLYNQYAMLGAEEDRSYGRHRDEVGDWQTERDYLAGRFDSERDYDYGRYDSERDLAYSQYEDDRTLAYQTHRDEITDSQWLQEFEEAKRRWDAQYGDAYSGGTTTPAPAGSSGKGKTGTGKTPIVDAIKDDTPHVKYDYESDLNDLIAGGASKSEINNYLREAYKAGLIDQAQYNALKSKYAPRGYTYR